MGEADGQDEGSDGVGGRLRTAREAAGLLLPEIAASTRVNARYLKAIEAGDIAGLPAAPYSVGFVKAFARAVGLDSATLAADFRREMDLTGYAPIEAVRYEPADPARVPSAVLAWTAAVIALVLVVGYSIWRSGAPTGESATDRARIAAQTDRPIAPVPTPSMAPPAVMPPPAATGPVLLTAAEPAWIRVYERDGTTLFQGELAQGQSYEVPATATDPLIRLGRAEALKVSVGGREVAPLGPPAQTIKDVSLLGPALLARGSLAAGSATAAPTPATP